MLGLSVVANKGGQDHLRKDICSQELAVGLLSEVRLMAINEALARKFHGTRFFGI